MMQELFIFFDLEFNEHKNIHFSRSKFCYKKSFNGLSLTTKFKTSFELFLNVKLKPFKIGNVSDSEKQQKRNARTFYLFRFRI